MAILEAHIQFGVTWCSWWDGLDIHGVIVTGEERVHEDDVAAAQEALFSSVSDAVGEWVVPHLREIHSQGFKKVKP